MKYTQNQQIKFINALAKKTVEKGSLSKDIYDKFKILDKDSKKEKRSKYNTLFRSIELQDKNFILVNHLNMIRYQTYLFMLGSLLVDTKFGFWKSSKGNGEYVIIEDILEATTRTGDIITDAGNITPAPAVENQLLMFATNKAADIPKNPDIEKWATLEGATGWVNDRLRLLKNSLDFPLSTYLKDQINNYSGYSVVLIDDTRLDDEQKATALQKAIGKIIKFITNDYRDTHNESIDGGTTSNFKYKMDLTDIGLIFGTETDIDQEMDYFRRLYKEATGSNENNATGYSRDYGVGNIISMDLTNNNEVILLPKQKMIWNAQYGNGTTPLWFSLQELITEYVFYGHVFTKSAPGIVFRFGSASALQQDLQTQLGGQISKIKEGIKKISAMVEPTGFKEFKRKQAEAVKYLKEQLKIISTGKEGEEKPNPEYIKKIIENAKLFKASDLLKEKDTAKVEIDLTPLNSVLETLNLKIELVNEKLKNSDADTKKLLDKELKALTDEKEAKAKEAEAKAKEAEAKK